MEQPIKLYEHIRGNDITKLDEGYEEPLVNGMINKEDYVLIVAEEKIGKTVFAQYLTCCMSSGTPFLRILDIPKPLKVLYMATEGKPHELKKRFINISHAIPTNFDNIILTPTCFFFNTITGVTQLQMAIIDLGDFKPDVIIVDALYHAIAGELTKDSVVNAFNHELSLLQRRFGCAMIVVHHMTKPTRNNTGQLNERSDKDTYGSTFLLAAVDQVYRLERWTKDKEHKKDLFLRCTTQRSGDKIDEVRLRMVEPDPLYYEIVSQHEKEKHIVKELLKVSKDGLNMESLIKKSSLGRTILFTVLKELEKESIIERVGNNRGKIYKYAIK